MPSPSHDVLVQSLRDDPALLGSLLARATGRSLPGPPQPMDSTVRFSRSAEVRPDLVVRTGDTWLACEVQNRLDRNKGRRWLLCAAALHDGTRRMGELVVITASRRVARWARRVAHVSGPLGTTLRLSPLVLLLDTHLADKLLDSDAPELALCAAWAMQYRKGPRARAIVERAIEVTETLPEPLREAQLRAILSVLSKELRALLEQIMINPDHIPESPAHRRLRLLMEEHGRIKGRAEGELKGRAEGELKGRAEGELKGLAESLFLILEARGLPVTASERAEVLACTDPARLAAWTRRALTATSVVEALSPAAPKAPARGSRSRRRRPANGG